MPILDFIITVFCLIDDEYKKLPKPIRQRGFEPALSDSEVITMEVIGEFLAIDTDKGIWSYFKTHYLYLFPHLKDRTVFVRQAANLFNVKNLIRRNLVKQLDEDTIHIADDFPIPICTYSKATRCKRLTEYANFGYCASKDLHYFGLCGHLIINSQGLITTIDAATAHADERDVLPELIGDLRGLLLADKGYIKKELTLALKKQGLSLVTPWRKNMIQSKWMPHWLQNMLGNARRIIETVIGQLTERFHIEKVRAKDLWHFSSRLIRKALSHTTAVLVCKLLKLPTLQFEKLII
jgi:DDE family transposase